MSALLREEFLLGKKADVEKENYSFLDHLKKEFPHSGVVDFEEIKEEYLDHFNRYQNWISKNYHGKMSYLDRGQKRRHRPKEVFPDLKSVLVVGVPYAPWKKEKNEFNTVQYASYLNGEDYHSTVSQKIELFLKEQKKSIPDLSYKVCVDTSAVLERSLGALAGLGWIGKNTMLIHPKLGSYFFIGIAFLNQEFGEKPEKIRNYCGHCELCLKSCPTSAFVQNNQLDARKCISYLTLEYREEFSQNLKRKMTDKVAGCDICQEVCPFNQKNMKSNAQSYSNKKGAIKKDHLFDLLKETEDEYKRRVKGSSLSRVKPKMFQRNLAAVVQNAILMNSFSDSQKIELDQFLRFKRDDSSDDIKKEWEECLNLLGSQKNEVHKVPEEFD